MEWGTCWVKHKPRLKIFKKAGWGAALQCIQLEGAVWGHFQIDQNLFQGILVALRGDQDHRVGSFDILVEKSWTLFSGVELVSFNFGLPGWVGFLEVFGKKKDWDL